MAHSQKFRAQELRAYNFPIDHNNLVRFSTNSSFQFGRKNSNGDDSRKEFNLRKFSQKLLTSITSKMEIYRFAQKVSFFLSFFSSFFFFFFHFSFFFFSTLMKRQQRPNKGHSINLWGALQQHQWTSGNMDKCPRDY